MTDLPDEETIPARRSPPVADPPTDGSTFIARRESRRRESRRAAHDPAGHGATAAASDRLPPSPLIATSPRRVAAVPDAAAGVVYAARAPEPVIAARAAPSERIPQAPVDGVAAASAHRRRARRTAVIVLISASAVALAAAASLLVVALTP